jgi:flagellar basal-body rod protein FlgG
MRALHTAASGMMAQELNVEVISNNIANMRTAGFKRQRAEFQDLLYQHLRRVGSSTSEQGTMVPAGVEVGSGVRTAATPRIMSQGNVLMTEKETDVAVRGEGFFRVQLPDGRIGFTRDGSFNLDAQGRLVNADGYVIEPGITVPNNATGFTVSAAGQVSVMVPGSTTPTELGTLQLARFVNKSGLESIGDNMFIETAASGPPVDGAPGSEGFGSLLQNHIEQANVESVKEIADLIAAQRAYEMNARVISGADQMLQATAGMMR